MRYRGAALLLPVLAATSAGARAETLYVIETLVVNVSSAPDTTGERVANIKSGDAVEVIERQNDQVHIRLANGTEGWIKKSYLSADEPLHKQLNERTAEVDKLKQDVARLEGEVAAAKTGARGTGVASATTTRAAAATPAATSPAEQVPARNSTPDSTNTPADAPAHEPPYFMTPPDAPAHPVWHWALGSFVVALVLGFAMGWTVLDRRIRSKYGGLRIY